MRKQRLKKLLLLTKKVPNLAIRRNPYALLLPLRIKIKENKPQLNLILNQQREKKAKLKKRRRRKK